MCYLMSALNLDYRDALLVFMYTNSMYNMYLYLIVLARNHC